MEKKKCLECSEPIIGRIDKKFCNDLCRNAYNNRLNSDSTNLVRNINNILRRNRRIIEELAPDNKAKVHKDKLIAKGFDFRYFTHLLKTQKGSVYYFCYEYGYLPLESNWFFLVKQSNHKE
ncbi:MAG: hypothetical protein IT239_03905 [Bacteroidia bacterium]|nr:hypothetical protein [Bacteroidia bacterium]